MKRYDFTAPAVEDLRRIGTYTRTEWGVDQAGRYRQELELAIQKLSLMPTLGRPRSEIAEGLRSFQTASHIAFYLTRDDGITVIRLLHPSMDTDRAFGSAK